MSLNDVLYKGICLNADLYSLLLKFRVHPIVLSADIENAYLQININEEHRDYLRFLCYRNLKELSDTGLRELFLVLRHLNSY